MCAFSKQYCSYAVPVFMLYGVALGCQLVPAAMLPDVVEFAAVRDSGVRVPVVHL
jgi:hypothetical protein